jgi:hypothetical protein
VPGVHPEPTFEELPMPAAMAAAIRRSGGWELPATAVGAAALGAGIYVGVTSGPASEGAFVLLGVAGLVLLAAWLSRRGRLQARRSGHFVRAHGRIEVADVNHAEGGSWEFRAGKRSFGIEGKEYRALAGLIDRARWADFSEDAGLLFELRDADDKVLWRNPKYRGT